MQPGPDPESVAARAFSPFWMDPGRVPPGSVRPRLPHSMHRPDNGPLFSIIGNIGPITARYGPLAQDAGPGI